LFIIFCRKNVIVVERIVGFFVMDGMTQKKRETDCEWDYFACE